MWVALFAVDLLKLLLDFLLRSDVRKRLADGSFGDGVFKCLDVGLNFVDCFEPLLDLFGEVFGFSLPVKGFLALFF